MNKITQEQEDILRTFLTNFRAEYGGGTVEDIMEKFMDAWINELKNKQEKYYANTRLFTKSPCNVRGL